MAALGLAGLAALCALAYAIRYLDGPPSLPRTALKVLSILLLALAALIEGGPLLLVAGLAFSALGDGFLAQDGRLRAGMAAFGAAHLCYVLMFLLAGGGPGPGWLQAIVQFALLIGAGAMVRWLRPALGTLAIPVYVYAALVTLMAVLGTGLPGVLWIAALGAIAFFLSDGLLAAQLFRLGRDRADTPLTDRAIWALYWVGQALITAGFLARPG